MDETKKTEHLLNRKKSEKSEEEFYSSVKSNIWRPLDEPAENVSSRSRSNGANRGHMEVIGRLGSFEVPTILS